MAFVCAGMAMSAGAVEHKTVKDEKAGLAEYTAPAVKAAYVCPDCHVMALQAGNCSKCGKAMTEMHLLAVKGGEAMLCSCGADCTCAAKDMKDGKCSCGKDVVKMSVKGMYVCPKHCPVISEKAGKCGVCGAELKKAE